MGNRMSALVILGDTSGSITLQAPAAAGSSVHTLPAATGTVMVSGNMPAFSAYASSTTSLGDATNTTLIFNVKDFDTSTCYNNTGSTVTLNGISVPAYSFAPNVAGYYQMNCSHYVGSTGGSSNMALQFFKNGSQYLIANGSSGTTNTYMQAASLMYLNGTSDYVTAVMYWTGSGAVTGSGVGYKFSGVLMRAA
jgi:hypothetical protein